MLWGPLHFLTFPLLFWEFWKELCFRGTRDGVSVCKKPLARGNCVMLMDFSRLWQFAVFRIWLCGCEGAVVLCSSCRFAPCHSSDVMLLCAAVGWSRTALASRALLHPHPAFLKTVCRKVASYWEEVVFPVHTCTDGCNLAFFAVSYLCLGIELSLLLFHLHTFHLVPHFGWWGKYVAGRGWEDQRHSGDSEAWECWLRQEAKGVKECTVGGHSPKGERGRVLSLSGGTVLEGYIFLFLGFKDVRLLTDSFAAC